MPIKFTELVENFELMSMTSGDSHAYLCRQSGEFYCRMDPLYVGEEYAGELPEDIGDEEKYVALRRGALEQWHDFERKATERALREWCELNSIELID